MLLPPFAHSEAKAFGITCAWRVLTLSSKVTLKLNMRTSYQWDQPCPVPRWQRSGRGEGLGAELTTSTQSFSVVPCEVSIKPWELTSGSFQRDRHTEIEGERRTWSEGTWCSWSFPVFHLSVSIGFFYCITYSALAV